jgi:hypothetical protein
MPEQTDWHQLKISTSALDDQEDFTLCKLSLDWYNRQRTVACPEIRREREQEGHAMVNYCATFSKARKALKS